MRDRTAWALARCASLDLGVSQRYGLALALPLSAAALLRADGTGQLLAALPAIMVCALLGGSGPALLAGAAAMAAMYAQHHLSGLALASLQSQLLFSASAAASIALICSLRQAVRAQLQPAPCVEDAFSNVFDNVPVALMIVRLSDGQLVAVNSAFSELWGYTSGAALGRTSAQLSLWVEPQQLIQQLRANCHSDTQELQARTAAGQVRDVLASVRMVQFRNAAHLLVAAEDVTERKRVRELEHMANHDLLTTLPNRLLLESRLQRAGERTRNDGPSAVVFIDLDGFKQVNDSLGHAAGDELLRLAALRMQSRIRSGDTLARVGGDEFVVLLENLPAAEAEVVAGELLACLSTPFVLARGTDVRISASIGISYFDARQPGAATLACRQADAALYGAKRAGRNTVRVFPPATGAGADSEIPARAGATAPLQREAADEILAIPHTSRPARTLQGPHHDAGSMT